MALIMPACPGPVIRKSTGSAPGQRPSRGLTRASSAAKLCARFRFSPQAEHQHLFIPFSSL